MNKLFDLTQKEFDRQRDTLNLIASENYPSPATLELLGSVWQNRYSEGYPGKRYYAGQIYTDELELFVQQKALEVFDVTGEYGCNVQLLSGSPANAMVYMAALEAGDTIMSIKLANGGHLSHLHDTSAYKKFFKHVTYDVKESKHDLFEIDVDDFAAQLKAHKPKLTIIGFSAYPRKYEFAQLCRLAHEAGSLVLADIAHINGLVAVGLHDTPFQEGVDGADYITMTTHKTMRGPRGALVFAKQELMEVFNKTVFPGTSGGPHMHTIAATGQALLEILGEEKHPDGLSFKEYSQNTIDSCQALEGGLKNGGLEVISPTQNHLCLVRLPEAVDSLELQKKLESLGIILNRNMIFNDTKSAWRPSGLRLGTAALTSRGLVTEQAQQLGELIAAVALEKLENESAQKQVDNLVAQLNWHYTNTTI